MLDAWTNAILVVQSEGNGLAKGVMGLCSATEFYYGGPVLAFSLKVWT
jgi:hypothetical protein